MADTPITDINKLSKSSQDTIAANAKSQGVSPQEYLAQRGGLYASGYYGDTPEFRRLSDADYAAAAAKGGAGAINAALTAKKRAAFIADPSLIEDSRLRLAYQNGTITIDELLNVELPGSVKTTQKTPEPIGAMADGTPIYGYGSDGKPVTSSTGSIYSTVSSSDAVSKFSSGASPLSSNTSSSGTSTTGTTDQGKADRQSAYDLLYNEFNKYGLGSLVDGIKGLIQSNISPSQFSIELQNTDAYKKRFAANQDRIKAGLKALSPAEYIGLEDQYQNIMRNYGLPASYYTKDSMGTQVGFEKFLANDVSASELEDRVATAQQRVLNSNPEVLQALKQFYPDISNADILSYALDPSQALTNIKRKVTAAEIGGAALAQGLQASGGTAESLAGLGITKAQAQQGYTDVAGMLPRGSQLADIYGQQAYTQGTAEAEVFNTAGAADAAARRKKLTSLETAQFSGSSGVGALGRDKSLYGAMQGQAGLY